MTREHKLALIIGFSLILFVGILISDHLSKAGGGVYAPATDAERRLAESIGPLDVGLSPSPLPERPSGAIERYRAPRDRAAGRSPEDSGWAQPPEESAPSSFEPEPAPMRIAESPDQGLGAGMFIPVEPGEGTESLIQSGWRLLDQVVTGIGETRFAPRPALEIQQSRGAPAPGALLPEEPFVTHIVQPGESLYQIAQRYYGAGMQWTRVRDFNVGRIGDDGMVRVGVTIRIPGVEQAATAGAPAGGAAAATSATSPAPAATREYTVRKNDTLGEIAQQLLGSARRRAEIVELNRDKISNEDEIRIGMVLAIPAG